MVVKYTCNWRGKKPRVQYIIKIHERCRPKIIHRASVPDPAWELRVLCSQTHFQTIWIDLHNLSSLRFVNVFSADHISRYKITDNVVCTVQTQWLKWGGGAGEGGSAPLLPFEPPPAIVWAPLVESIKCYFMPK